MVNVNYPLTHHNLRCPICFALNSFVHLNWTWAQCERCRAPVNFGDWYMTVADCLKFNNN